ncbi:MAG: hypothetical protein LH632_09255 [Rhodoferax sp.]|nr:hypothetical protein [Rhodoferax sp.]
MIGARPEFKAALEQWPTQGLPANPNAWLTFAGRFKAIWVFRTIVTDYLKQG